MDGTAPFPISSCSSTDEERDEPAPGVFLVRRAAVVVVALHTGRQSRLDRDIPTDYNDHVYGNNPENRVFPNISETGTLTACERSC